MKAKVIVEIETNMFEVQRLASQLKSALEKTGITYKVTVLEQIHSIEGPEPQTFYNHVDVLNQHFD